MDGWQRARLIPTSGMSGQDEQEARATSSLLAVLTAVKEFGNGLVRELGGVTGTIETFIEIPFVLADGRSVRPDGLIRATRAAKTWVCLVEVKTGNSPLSREQVESYLDLAREQKFDALVTISNDLAPAPGVHPVEFDRRKAKSVELHHRSWAELLSLAVMHRVHTAMSELLKTVRLDPNVLVADLKADIRRFRVSATSQLGTKRGVGRGSFIDSILSAVDGIYGSVLQSIRPWAAKPPQLPKPGSAVDTAVVELRLSPTEVDEMQAEGFAPPSETSPRAVPVDWASLPVPSADHRIEKDPPMVSWDDQLDDLAEERQLTPLTSE